MYVKSSFKHTMKLIGDIKYLRSSMEPVGPEMTATVARLMELQNNISMTVLATLEHASN